MEKICHLTSVHPRYDTRIFVKECQSLQKAGFEVFLIVADNLGNEIKNNINIIDAGKESSRLKRIFNSTKRILSIALEIDADIYHFHDPELIPIGLKLIKKGKKVIYDVHEDLPRQLITKPYLNKFIRKIIAFIFEIYENNSVKKFSYLMTATDFIRDRFINLNKNSVAIKNYPLIGDIETNKLWEHRKNQFVYIGLLSKERGISELVEACNYTDFELHVAGKFINAEFEQKITSLPEWQKVKFHGFLNRDQISDLLSDSKIGIVTLYPTINYKDALPVKMFEYMLAGIPVIASNIELWETILNQNNCGISVDPFSPKMIAEAINNIINDDEKAQKMGQSGQKAILNKLNWKEEEQKILNIYKNLSTK